MIQSLHVAQTGLYAAKVSVENVMNNITNENTPGYKKRVANLSEAAHIDAREYGRGVSVDSVTRVTNMYMYDNLIKQQSKESYLTQLSTSLSDIESIFYETDSSGFSNDLDRYFQSIENLRSNPKNQIYKNNVSEQSKILVQTLQTLYTGIEDKEVSSKNTVYDNIDTINGLLGDIGKINEQIGQRLVEPNDLLDKRDQLEQELAKYIDIDVDRTDNYQLKIGGQVAVRYSTNIHNVKVITSSATQKDYFSKSDFVPTFASGDKLTYRIDNGMSENVTFGEAYNGKIDINNDGVLDNVTVDSTNFLRVLTDKINRNSGMTGLVSAYNGENIAADGTVSSLNFTSDNDLVLYSTLSGSKGQFAGRMVFFDSSANTKNAITKSTTKSVEPVEDFHIEIFDQELNLQSGGMRAMIENLDSQSSDNLFKKYKDALNNIAAALSDITNGYISNGNGGYFVGGLKEYDSYTGAGTYNEVGLFKGNTVKTLTFNDAAVSTLTQDNLDYLATTQWNENIKFNSSSTGTSFTKYFQTLQVEISADKENVDFRKDTQSAVTESLRSNYDQQVKVDKDAEMINLIQFQAAYEASAKIVTMVDEMLQTILGMKR